MIVGRGQIQGGVAAVVVFVNAEVQRKQHPHHHQVAALGGAGQRIAGNHIYGSPTADDNRHQQYCPQHASHEGT
ncbi:hypothetical protein SDC9_210546 [bioreactor metagenome]|uniref:Uncharacterized protein n=1 Tax=bioreactor metagenome TaxID=1076179 RepID=A0A645JU51_9ZZZZ